MLLLCPLPQVGGSLLFILHYYYRRLPGFATGAGERPCRGAPSLHSLYSQKKAASEAAGPAQASTGSPCRAPSPSWWPA